MASKTPLLQPAQGTSAWNEPLNANFQTVTNAMGNIQSVSVSSGYALTSTEAVNLGFILTGSLGSAQNITIPNNIVGSWIVVNSTSGAGSITFKTVGGTGVQLSAGATILYSDGTNVYSAIAGSGASYLPTSGGTVSGNLAITGTLGVDGTSTLGDTTIPAGKTFTIASGANFALSGAFSPSFISLGGNQVSPYLLTLTGVAAGGSMAYMNGLVTIPSGAGNGLQVGTSDGLSGNRFVVNGTSNLIGNVTIPQGNTLTISGGSSTGTTRLTVTGDASISGALSVGSFTPTNITASGTIQGTTITGTTALVSNGNITASSGTITGSSIVGTASGSTTLNGPLTANNTAIFKSTVAVDASATPAISFRNTSGSNFGIVYTSIGGGTGIGYTGGSTAYVSAVSNGGLFATGPYTNYSDIKLKTNIETINNATSIVKSLRGVYFNYKENLTKKQIGLIAQEVEPVLPEVVSKFEDDNLGIQYSSIVAVLINSIKELEARIAVLEAQLP